MATGKEKRSEESNIPAGISRDVKQSSDFPTHDIVQQKREIVETAESESDVHFTPPVKILLVIALLVFLLLVYLVYRFIHATLAHDENVENKILSGKRKESLSALKKQNFEILIVVFALIFFFCIFVGLIGFACLMFYSQASMQKERRMTRVLIKAAEVVDIQETKLSANLYAEKDRVSQLQNNIVEYERKINKQRQAEEANQEEIKLLEDEKAEKVAELHAANEKLEESQKDLEEARELQKDLKENIEKEAQSKRELEQKLVNEKARTTKLEANLTSEAKKLKTALSNEQSQSSSLRSRVSDYETLRSKITQLEAENRQLREKLQKNSTWTGWLWGD